jgi:hypothetical protein
MIDASDTARLGEGWDVFGACDGPPSFFPLHVLPSTVHFALLSAHPPAIYSCLAPSPDTVLAAPQTLHVPLLLLANKQDAPGSLSPADIRTAYEQWFQARRDAARAAHGTAELEARHERAASLDVLGVSALEGCVVTVASGRGRTWADATRHRTGVREAVDWLFLRVQNSPRRCVSLAFVVYGVAHCLAGMSDDGVIPACYCSMVARPVCKACSRDTCGIPAPYLVPEHGLLHCTRAPNRVAFTT